MPRRSVARRLAAVVLAAAPALVLCSAASFAEAEDKDGEAGHPRYYVHRIRLLDENRQPIAPDGGVPYSPRQTCSGPECHSYEAIARGMHFDMGKSRLSDDWGKAHAEPWHLSPGMVGGFLPTFRRQYARKANARADAIDLTAYEFVKACGACHPGGGALELDRDGQRYDAVMKAAKEKGQDLAASLDGDYHKARWDQSGVVEIDCLMCHALWPYDNEERAAQLRDENYRFAATAAAGFGLVAGKVSEAKPAGAGEDYDPMNPVVEEGRRAAATVAYDRRLFDSQGYVTLDIGRPRDHACLFCHHFPALRGGEGFAHRHWSDVHTSQGLACVDCHSADIEHRFELGRALHYSVATQDADLTQTHGEDTEGARNDSTEAAGNERPAAMSCQGCHEEGHLGAPRPRHVGFPRFHFDEIACAACHAGPALTVSRQRTEPVLSDTSASTPQSAGLQSAYPDPQAPWQIVYQPRGGQIRVHNAQEPIWWGNRLGARTVWPLFPREVASAFEKAGDQIKDDDGDGVAEVNTEGEILAMDAALRGVLQGGRFEKVEPAYVRGDRVLWVEDGKVTASGGVAQARPLCVTMGHVVLGPHEALGGQGCTDCHSRASYFFNGRRVVDPAGLDHRPRTRSMRRGLGLAGHRVRLSALRESLVKPLGLALIPLTLVACLLHYVVFSPKRIRKDDPDDEVPRFTPFERLVHLCQMLCFVVLAGSGTGFLVAARWRDAVSHVWTSGAMETVHSWTGYVFLVSSGLLIVRWLPASVFRRYDLQWLRVMGGYLWMKGKTPAGKFNAGQKLLFWLVACACIVLGATGLVMALRPAWLEAWRGWAFFLHNVAAAIVVPAILGHVYLGTLANPGTLRSIFVGTVTRAWAAKHHPQWLEEEAKAD